jgi:thioredoxin-like negative regulator of GroEL
MKTIKTKAQWKKLVGGSKIPVVVDFGADWCGPCKAAAPHVVKLATTLEGKVAFFRVDVDDAPSDLGDLDVQAVPTFAYLGPRGRLMFEVSGWDGPAGLRRDVVRLMAELTDAPVKKPVRRKAKTKAKA